jgi:DHA1 family bicyclomycin/chloramphenicol resistance-like MFS transporter
MTTLSDSATAPTRPTLTPVLLAVLALLSSFTPLSIDMYLPAMPVIAADLKGSEGDVQLTLSAFMVSFGLGQIFYGPAGDRFGRRPVILGGIAIYVLTSIGCAFAAATGHLIMMRFLQGASACGGVVLARTMVRDLAERDQAARAMSLMMACTSIAPMVAPLLGGQILWYLGWRAIFFILAGIGLFAWTAAYIRLPETLRPEYRQPMVLAEILRRFGQLLRHKPFMGYALTSSFQFAALLSFLSGSPFVFIERYGVHPRAYGFLFGGLVVFMTIGSLLNARFAMVFGSAKILRYVVFVPLVCGPVALVLGQIEARYGTLGMWPFIVCFAPQIASIGVIGANATALALQRYPHMAGTASSLMGVMQFGLGALFGAVVGQTLDGTIAPMTVAMGIAGFLCFASNRLLVSRSG